MKTVIYLSIVLSGILFLGCSNKCCDCDTVIEEGNTNLRLIRNWSKLWEGMSKPEKVDVYFYNDLNSEPQTICTYKDTTDLTLGNGSYNILAVSDRNNITGLENYQTAKVSLPVRLLDDGKYITIEPSISTVATFTTALIDGNRGNECTITLRPIVYIINFRIKIRTDYSVEGIVSCKAELQNVITSRMLSGGNDPAEVSAILQLPMSEKGKNIFDKRVSILGLSGTGNFLDVFIECKDGTFKSAIVDLTKLFDFSLSPVQNCFIDLYVNTDQVTAEIENVRIENWGQGDDDNIELL